MAYRVQARVGVQAPPAAVWAAMEDFDRWGEWNPFYVAAEGKMSIGSVLELTREMDDKREVLSTTVMDWVPGGQLVWRRSISLFAHSMGYIEIDGLTETASILSAGEIFEGLIGERLGRSQRGPLLRGFTALCEALKARAEASWDGSPDLSVVPPAPLSPKPKAMPKPMQMNIFGRRK